MSKAIWIFIIIFPLIFIPGYINYTIYKFAFLNFYIIGLWILFMFKYKNQFKKISRAEIYLLLFIIFVMISTLFSIDIHQSLVGSDLRHEGFPIFISYASLFFFSYRFIEKEKKQMFIKTLVIVSFISCFYGILQHYQIDPLPRLSYQTNWTRSFSFFGNPNFFGSFITLTLPLSMILYLQTDKMYRYFYLLTSSIIFLTLLLSETRSGWLGSFVAYTCMFIIIIYKRNHLWKKWIILSLSFFIIFLAVNYSDQYHPVTNRIDKTIEQISTDVNRGGSNRIFIWRKSLPLVSEYWLHGSGPDTFGLAFPNDDTNDYIHGYVDKAHNEYLHITVTLGIPALIFYLLFIFEVMKHIIKTSIIQNEKNRCYSYTIFSAVIGYLVQAFFNISVVVVAPYFWVILGLSYHKNHSDYLEVH